MDNLTKDNSGEIYSGESGSSYQEAVAPPTENLEPEAPYQEQQEGLDQYGPPPENGVPPPSAPPPFVEDNRKKYLIFAIMALIILGIILFLLRVFLGSKPPKTEEKIQLTYWGLWEENQIIQPVIDEYQKDHPNITINYNKQSPKEYRERLQAALERGEGPDIFRFHNTWRPMLRNHLSAVPNDVYSEEEYEKIFYPVTKTDLKQGGSFYGIPLEIDGLLLFYNEDILKSANVTPPATWLDLQKAAEKITVKEGGKIVTAGVAMGTAENVEHFSDILALMMLQNGTQLSKSLFSCSDKTVNTCAVEALSFYRKFAESPNNFWDETLDNSIVAFIQEKVAMIFAPSWQALVIKESKPNLNFKVAPVPQLPCEEGSCPRVDFATFWVEGVSNKSKYQRKSWEFLKYLSSEETMKKLYALQIQQRKLFGEPYSRVSLANLLSDNPYLAPLMAEAPYMKSFPLSSRTFDGETGLNSMLIKYLKDAVNKLSSGVSPETALQTVENGFNDVKKIIPFGE